MGGRRVSVYCPSEPRLKRCSSLVLSCIVAGTTRFRKSTYSGVWNLHSSSLRSTGGRVGAVERQSNCRFGGAIRAPCSPRGSPRLVAVHLVREAIRLDEGVSHC